MLDLAAVENLFRDSTDLVVVLGPDRRVRSANEALLKAVLGARTGVDFMSLVPEPGRERIGAELAKAAGGATLLLEIEHPGPDGQRRRVEYRFFPVDGGHVAAIGRLRAQEEELTEQLGRVNEELREKTRILDSIQIELTQVPFVDPVTGVWNRLQVVERLTGEWSRSERYGSPIACLLVEAEGVAEARARHGSYVADEVLKAVARRLKRTVRDHDVVGRYGGDRFVVVAIADAEGAKALGLRLRGAVGSEPVAVGDRRFAISVRIGGATNRSEGVEILEDLFTVAETSLEEARRGTEGLRVAEEMGV
jgi:diguanylate cyclase (GGDEF)-like protein